MKRVCLLTGASGTLGEGFIRHSSSSYEIVAVYRQHEPEWPHQRQRFVDPLRPGAELPENAQACYAMKVDLRDADEVERLCDEVVERYGCVDLVINAAAERSFKALADYGSFKDAETAFRVNVLAPTQVALSLARRAWKYRVSENLALRRNVVNVSSTAGVYVYPDLGQGMYGSTKAALNFMTYHLASELWNVGIRVNAIAPNTFPGIISTQSVVERILALDAAETTGSIVVLE